jgi:predicted thioesterase
VSRRASETHAHQPPLRTGLVGRAELKIEDADTALAWRSGDVRVLATPRLLALCEEATVKSLEGALSPDRTSVATRVQFDHLAPAAVGDTVTAEATLVKVEGRRLVFTVSATVDTADRAGLVGAGRLVRVLVDRETFLMKAGELPRS